MYYINKNKIIFIVAFLIFVVLYCYVYHYYYFKKWNANIDILTKTKLNGRIEKVYLVKVESDFKLKNDPNTYFFLYADEVNPIFGKFPTGADIPQGLSVSI